MNACRPLSVEVILTSPARSCQNLCLDKDYGQPVAHGKCLRGLVSPVRENKKRGLLNEVLQTSGFDREETLMNVWRWLGTFVVLGAAAIVALQHVPVYGQEKKDEKKAAAQDKDKA